MHDLRIYKAKFWCNSEMPSNLILRKISPKIWLPALTVAWGIVTMCLGFVRNYAGFVTVRAVLGMCEGGLLPGMVRIRPIWVKRNLLMHSPGLVLIGDVHQRGNGAEDWSILHVSIPERRLWRPPSTRAC
jgi:hypothetical protein